MPGAFKKRPPIFLLGVFPPEGTIMHRVQHTFTADELLHLKATPIQLLPAPGPGKFYAAQLIIGYYTFNTTPFTLNASAYFVQSGAETFNVLLYMPGFITETEDTANVQTPFGVPALATAVVNQPLAITIDGPAELTLGDGTLLMILYYTIESTT
jgi:hypothetical protein